MKDRRKPKNTSKEAQENPYLVLLRGMADGASGSIERQEWEGQAELIDSDTLPSDMSKEDKKALKKAGCVFHGEVEGDPVFQYVTLPEGWKRVQTEDSRHTNLVDAKGRKRAGMFYKAAWYDRRANLVAATRYGYRVDYDKVDEEKAAVCNIMDGDEVIHSTIPVMILGDQKAYGAVEEARRRAKIWLDAEYPEWKDPSAYWD